MNHNLHFHKVNLQILFLTGRRLKSIQKMS